MAVPHVELFYEIKDAKKGDSRLTQKFPVAADLAVVADYARGTGQFLDAIMKGLIVGYGITLRLDLADMTGIKTAAAADSDVEEGARFSFNTEVGGLTGFRVPTFDEAFLVPGTNLVDTADAAVISFVDRMIAGRTLGLITVEPSDQYGNDVVSLASATESFQSS